jgi:hypothetical protein
LGLISWITCQSGNRRRGFPRLDQRDEAGKASIEILGPHPAAPFQSILPLADQARFPQRLEIDVPAGPGSESVPAAMAARAAEWSLGDEIRICASAHEVRFVARNDAGQ